MKRLLAVIILAAAAWSLHWVWAAQGKRGAVEDWLSARAAEGWQAEAEIAVAGFPNRVDLTLSDLRLATPDGALAWDAPFFQILTLSYRSGHEILIFPPEMTLAVDGAEYRVSGDGLRASIVHDGPALERLNAEAEVLNVARAGEAVALAGLAASMLREGDAGYRVSLQADALARSDRAVTGSAAPEAAKALSFDSRWQFDRAWRFDDLSGARPQPVSLDLRLMEYVFGQLELKLAGKADIDDRGRLDGEITVKAVNWREILRLAREAQVLPETWSDALEDGLTLLAGLAGNRETLDLPLTFRSGRMSLGPLPLGDGPRITVP